MGRKKSNARSLPHGKKIHVNKYITKHGNTKKKMTGFEVPSTGRLPVLRNSMRSGSQNLVTTMALQCRVAIAQCWSSRMMFPTDIPRR